MRVQDFECWGLPCPVHLLFYSTNTESADITRNPLAHCTTFERTVQVKNHWLTVATLPAQLPPPNTPNRVRDNKERKQIPSTVQIEEQLKMATPGWASLRQQIRTLESQTESHFHTLSQYTSASLPEKPSPEEVAAEEAITDLFSKRDNLISQLSRLLDSESALSTSALKQNNLTRHRELLVDHKSELRRLKSQISEQRARQHLLSSVRNDIAESRTAEEQEAEYMLQERGHLDQSHSVIDGIISQAYQINENFGVQRETLANVNRRITLAASQLPGVNDLMARIGSKKRRDGIILGSFIAFCFLVFLWFS